MDNDNVVFSNSSNFYCMFWWLNYHDDGGRHSYYISGFNGYVHGVLPLGWLF